MVHGFETHSINNGPRLYSLLTKHDADYCLVSVISAQAQIYSSYLIRPCSTGTALRPSHQHAWYGPEYSERLGSVCGGEMF